MKTSNNSSEQDLQGRFRPKESIPTFGENVDESNNSLNLSHNYTIENNKSLIIKSTIRKDDIVSVFDVAKYILEKLNTSCTTMKLQKLVYYCQVWYLVWEDKPLFKEKIEAWANGPVVRTLFNFHQGLYTIDKFKLTLGNSMRLSSLQKEDIDSVLDFYGGKTSQWLIDQTHSEKPWIDARKGLLPSERGSREISPQSIVDYYSSLK